MINEIVETTECLKSDSGTLVLGTKFSLLLLLPLNFKLSLKSKILVLLIPPYNATRHNSLAERQNLEAYSC